MDRGKPGSKLHLLSDANALPLVVGVTAANTHDSVMFVPLLDGIPAIRSRRGPRRRRPAKLHADKGYDYPERPPLRRVSLTRSEHRLLQAPRQTHQMRHGLRARLCTTCSTNTCGRSATSDLSQMRRIDHLWTSDGRPVEASSEECDGFGNFRGLLVFGSVDDGEVVS